ncbi:hypothetical protein MRQ36_08860 [Micromonospora sp. R77]|uniref:hypothetical protein n=1 Tax=Micromonospora sp. R77 TaxID=2925836 RepID=UPI001F624166|nr:hypothetical protein [Micromonospora sp. R77]MCI4062674.1 hypothetical protein [Micromonospora sp. R77]
MTVPELVGEIDDVAQEGLVELLIWQVDDAANAGVAIIVAPNTVPSPVTATAFMNCKETSPVRTCPCASNPKRRMHMCQRVLLVAHYLEIRDQAGGFDTLSCLLGRTVPDACAERDQWR